jgi:hypothetical protein
MPTRRADKPGEKPMLVKILVVGAVLIGAMAAIREGSVLRDAGLLSSCNTITHKSEASTLSCSKGRLDGFPDLTNKSCTLISVHPTREYWRCQAPVVSSQSPTG